MRRLVLLISCLIPACLVAAPATRVDPGIAAFNDAFAAATRSMDTDASLALWEENGTSLLPSMQPLVGKPAIAAFVRAVVARMSGAHMRHFDLRCHDIRAAGAWASEWCDEHQVVALPGKPDFNGYGKMLLVLHRDADGHWRLQAEMWNQGVAPQGHAGG